ncbi:MAG: flagellar export protein FliJ [Methylovulum sp.]|nr:flagellar export protein FliJ [Methylovulum sp.]
MKKSQRIKALVDINAAQEKNALEVIAGVQNKLLAAQAQIDHLKEYRQEYQEKFDHLGSGGVKIAQLLEFRSFIDKLDKAILGQEQASTAIEQELVAKRKLWENLHYRTNSLQKVCDAAGLAELKLQDKREQLEQDERAARSGRSSFMDG